MAASSAVPPRLSTSYPASTASGCAAATTNCLPLSPPRNCAQEAPKTRRPPANAVRKFILGFERHLAEDLALLDQSECLVHFRERQRLVHDRPELPLADELEERAEVLAHEAVRSQHLDLEGPDVAQVFLRVEARGRAAGEHLAATVHRPERGHPGVPAGEVDHHVDAAFEPAPVGLAVLRVDPLH